MAPTRLRVQYSFIGSQTQTTQGWYNTSLMGQQIEAQQNTAICYPYTIPPQSERKK